MAATETRRRVALVAPVLAATLAIGWGSPAVYRADARGEPSPDVAEGGSMALVCAAVYLFVCGPWAPFCASLPSACYSRPTTIGP